MGLMRKMMVMLTNKIPLRFSKSSDVDMLTGTTVAVYLEDTMGDLPDIRFTDVEDFREYWKAIEKEFYEVYSEIRQLKIENRELIDENNELQIQLEAFQNKLCELGVSDVKLYGKRYSTGLEEWLE